MLIDVTRPSRRPDGRTRQQAPTPGDAEEGRGLSGVESLEPEEEHLINPYAWYSRGISLGNTAI